MTMNDHHDEVMASFSRIKSAADLLECVLDVMCDNPLLQDHVNTVAEAIRCFADTGFRAAELASEEG